MMSRIDIRTTELAIQEMYGKMRGPQNIMFDITQRCNMHCKHCYNFSSDNILCDLDDQHMYEIAKQIVEIKPCLVCLCGGEPTLRLPLVCKIAELLTQNGILVNMVSNGLLLNKDNIIRLFKSGIQNIQISLDSYRKEVVDSFRGKNGAFEKAFIAIQNIIQLGHIPSVTFIPTKLNYRDVFGLAELLYGIGVKNVRYMPFIAIGRGNANMSELTLNSRENEELFWLINRTEKSFEGFKFIYGDPLEHIYLFRNNYLSVTPAFEIKSNGDIQLTSYLPYKYGNASEHSLKELWDSGLDKIWKSQEFNKVVRKINTVSDLSNQTILPYTGNDFELHRL